MEQVSTTNQNKISRLFLIATLIEYGLIYGPFLVSIDFKYEVGGLDWSTQFFSPLTMGKIRWSWISFSATAISSGKI